MKRSLRYQHWMLILLILAVPVFAHEEAPRAKRPPAPVPPAELYRPTAVPDRIILTWQGDPARTQSVTWRTDTSVTEAIAQITTADPGPKFTDRIQTVNAVTTPLTTDLGTAHYHTARFENLTPSTKYVYRVGDGTNWSEWIHFRTASDKPEPFSFIYFGDAQNDIKSLWSRVAREAFSDSPRARFIIHAGDLINRANNDAEWGEWFYGAGWVNAMIPSIPTPGNHEYASVREGERNVRQLSKHWRPQFALPENGVSGLEETCYYLDYQGVRIISLNSNEMRDEQTPWLESVLKNNPNRWTILTFHHPIFSSAKNRDNPELRAAWKPILDKYRVDLVLQGHDHTYARSNYNLGVNTNDPKSGTVYVVSVSGPKMYNLNRQSWMKRVAEDTQLYQIIHINGDTLEYEARTATGALYDSFVIKKRPGRPNQLVERMPNNAPERLRPPAPATSRRSSRR